MLGIFKKKDSKNNDRNPVDWISLTSLEQLENITVDSEIETVYIFKHSTRCGISKMVLNRFEKSLSESIKKCKFYYLDLLAYRNISDQISLTFEIIHQSPQLLVIKNKVAVANASHYDILDMDIEKYA